MKKLIALVAAMVMVTGMAYAADWDFFGSARVSTFYTSVDADTAGTADVDTYSQALQGNARIGANVKVSDELTGAFEFGSGVNVRKLYGEWNFGSGTLLVGQTYSPLNMFYSNQVFGDDNDLLAEGGVYSGREQMIRLKFGDFQIAVVPVNTGNIVVGVEDGTTGQDIDGDGFYTAADAALTAAAATSYNLHQNADTDDYVGAETSFPAIEAKYVFKGDTYSIQLAGGYQTFELKNGSSNSIDIDSYVLALGGRVALGAAYFGGNVYGGQNPGYMISIDTQGGWGTGGMADVTGTTALDNDAVGWLLVGGYTLNDMFTFEAGYAAVSTELDGATVDDDSSSYYAQAVITMAPGVMVIPEVGVIDYDETGQGQTTYFGAKWQINF